VHILRNCGKIRETLNERSRCAVLVQREWGKSREIAIRIAGTELGFRPSEHQAVLNQLVLCVTNSPQNDEPHRVSVNVYWSDNERTGELFAAGVRSFYKFLLGHDFHLLQIGLIFVGHAVAYLVEALCHKQEGRGCDSRWRGFFCTCPNPSSRTMALGSTQPLTEMSTRNLPGSKGRPARKADNLTAICEPNIYRKNVGASTFHNPKGLHGLLQG
jgi:hypothetical protein